MKPSLVIPALFAALVSAASASAQGPNPLTTLTLSGFSGNLGTNVVNDYDQGFIASATGVTFTVAITNKNTIRTTAVSIRANAATMGGGKPVSSCQWRRSDLLTWNPLTTTNAVIESRVIQTNGTTWNNTVFFRCNLVWATDPPGTYSVGLTFTLGVTP